MGYTSSVRRLRADHRNETDMAATLIMGGHRRSTRITNVSTYGLSIRGAYDLCSGDRVEIEIGEGVRFSCTTKWRNGNDAGLLAIDMADWLLLTQDRDNAIAARPRSAASGSTVTETVSGFVGTSPRMQDLYLLIRQAAASGAPAYITGETGTGKEICAHAIHALSPAHAGAIVGVNCAAFPGELFESEMFGHRKGSFTGANFDRAGAVQQAHGGTLFLDEFSELTLHQQAKLLRFVQSGEYRRIGDEAPSHSTAQLICASHRDPKTEVKLGRLREDLFYRTHVIPIQVPPLRERGGDILELADFFLRKFRTKDIHRATEFTPAARDWMLNYDWPGNVRHLQNAVRNALAFSNGTPIGRALIERAAGSSIVEGPLADVHRPMERANGAPGHRLDDIVTSAIQSAIDQCQGSIPKAAALLDVSPSTIYRHLKSRNLTAKSDKLGSAGGSAN